MKAGVLAWLGAGLLWLAVLASAIGVVYTHHESRRLFMEQERLRKNDDQLHSEWTQLLLEQHTWASQGRIDAMASHELHMFLPAGTDIQVLEP